MVITVVGSGVSTSVAAEVATGVAVSGSAVGCGIGGRRSVRVTFGGGSASRTPAGRWMLGTIAYVPSPSVRALTMPWSDAESNALSAAALPSSVTWMLSGESVISNPAGASVT